MPKCCLVGYGLKAESRRVLKTRPSLASRALAISPLFDRLLTPLPGVGLALAAAGVAVVLNLWVPALSPLLVAIVLGAALSNLAGIAHRAPGLQPGLAVASKSFLRLGIVALGLQLVLTDIAALGWGVVLGVAGVVAGGIGATLLAGRWLKVAPSQTLLIACGFSICGAAAVAGIDGVLTRRKSEETATAVALVVVFGTVMIGVLPALAGVLGLDSHASGIWAGACIHEVAQVVAAGAIMGAPALKVAVVVKLARVLLLAPVLSVICWRQRREAPVSAGAKRPPLVPLFVVGFLAMVLLRSVAVLPAEFLAGAKIVETALLSAAMFALGCSVHWTVVRRAGGRTLALAAVATGVVTLLGLGTATLT